MEKLSREGDTAARTWDGVWRGKGSTDSGVFGRLGDILLHMLRKPENVLREGLLGKGTERDGGHQHPRASGDSPHEGQAPARLPLPPPGTAGLWEI